MDDAYYILKFHDLLKDALRKSSFKSSCAVLFSGGVDSSLTAKLAKDCGFFPTLLSLRTEKARDIDHIEKVAKFLDLPLAFVDVGLEEVKKELPSLKKILKDLNTAENLMQLSLGMVMYFLAKKAKSLRLNVCFCGQGSDELFAGYHKYKGIRDEELGIRIKKEFERLEKIDKMRDMGIFKEFGAELFSPFLTQKVVEFAFDLPLNLIRNKRENKIIVRRLAEKLGLPAFVYQKPKKALQYSTGMQKLVKKVLSCDNEPVSKLQV